MESLASQFVSTSNMREGIDGIEDPLDPNLVGARAYQK